MPTIRWKQHFEHFQKALKYSVLLSTASTSINMQKKWRRAKKESMILTLSRLVEQLKPIILFMNWNRQLPIYSIILTDL